MKIALSQLNYHIGNFKENVSKIKSEIVRAKKEGADLVVFAELAISGYPPRDFLEFKEFVDLCSTYLHEIAKECIDIAAVVGCPIKNESGSGKKLFNAACFLNEGKVTFSQSKSLLPTYDIFDEYRYFEPNKEFGIIEYKGKKIGLTICEDIWNVGNDRMYGMVPMDEIIQYQPDMVINISASPFSREHYTERSEMLKMNVEKYKIPFIYLNHVGAQTELIFDGNSMVCIPDKGIVKTMAGFDEDFWIYDTSFKYETQIIEQNETENVCNALVTGIRDYFRKSGFKDAVIGLSGGIDSALTVAIAARALGANHVKALLMPSPYSSDHSINDSIELCENIECDYEILKIHELIEVFDNTLKGQFKDLPKDLTEENIQARIRSILLMAVSNKFGSILLNTSNKSEKAVGYGTLYGDLSGGLSILGDVYKTDVYKLSEYINKNGSVIPNNILTKEPSAELRPDQKDSDSLPDYGVLDPILYLYIEENKSAPEIVELGYDHEIVERTLSMVNRSEYKRFQTAPILRVSKKAFGMGRRMPIVGEYLS